MASRTQFLTVPDGLAASFNSLLLTNIVRAAKGYPTYYSAIGDFSELTSDQMGLGIGGDLPLTLTNGPLLSNLSLNANLSPSVTRDRSANASSLETRDFAQAMHTPISPKLFLALTESRDRTHLNLTLALLLETVAITRAEYDQVIRSALDRCNAQFAALPSARQGICNNFSDVLNAACADDQGVPGVGKRASGIIQFYNDPTNPCEFDKFRTLVEAIVINNPHLEIDKDGASTVTLNSGLSSQSLFATKGTGFVLRSPHEVVSYLGEVVRSAYTGADGGLLRLSAPDGRSIPIFLVKSGGSAGRGAVAVRVDGEGYWIPRQELSAPETHYSYQALAIVKDIIALNTSESQLATSPTRIILGGGRQLN